MPIESSLSVVGGYFITRNGVFHNKKSIFNIAEKTI
jgi:hypothetical protein